jgi:hypothetical protein
MYSYLKMFEMPHEQMKQLNIVSNNETQLAAAIFNQFQKVLMQQNACAVTLHLRFLYWVL